MVKIIQSPKRGSHKTWLHQWFERSSQNHAIKRALMAPVKHSVITAKAPPVQLYLKTAKT